MNSDISILIPTHNRSAYLRRTLEYYLSSGITVYVVDSSQEAFKYEADKYASINLQYFYLPHKSLTGKISYALEKITTPYVVMCADDDFVIPSAIFKCVDFLSANRAFSAAMGNTICYKKNLRLKEQIEFFGYYHERLSFRTLEDDPIKRVADFFKIYRAIFYAVQRTEILKKTFEDAEAVINNLFLNEYLTAIYPVVSGHLIEMPILYSVREYSEFSGDKTTENIDAILFNEALKNEYDKFLDYEAEKIAPVVNQSCDTVKEALSVIIIQYAHEVRQLKLQFELGADKKIGKFIDYLPFFGKQIITAFRYLKNVKALPKFVKTPEETEELSVIGANIKKYIEIIK